MGDESGWRSRAQLVAREIGEDIISGTYAPGTILAREAELSARYQVSRNTLREAMKSLSAKALIEISPRRGTIVLPRARWNMLDREVIDWIGTSLWTDQRFLEEVLVIRAAIEPAAASEAARNASDAQKRAIEAAWDEMVSLANSGEIVRKVDVDLAWHVSVAAASNNRFLVSIMTGLVHALRSQLRMLNLREGNFEGNLENHGAVTRAIIDGDRETAERTMRSLVAHVQHDTDEMLQAR